jgi:hypothetical protein
LGAKPVGVRAVLQPWIVTANTLDCRFIRRRSKAFVVRTDEKLTTFVELDSVIRPGRTQRRTAEGGK